MSNLQDLKTVCNSCLGELTKGAKKCPHCHSLIYCPSMQTTTITIEDLKKLLKEMEK